MPRDFLSDENSGSPINESPIFQPRDFLAEPSQKENKLVSVALAIPRISEDIIKGGYHAIEKIPGLYESAKTEIPSALDIISKNPAENLILRTAQNQGMLTMAQEGMIKVLRGETTVEEITRATEEK